MKDLLVMNSILDFGSATEDRKQEMTIHVGGLYDDEVRGQVHPRWIKRKDLKIGDEVTIRIIESDSADKPVGEEVYGKEFAENQERQYYERLKAKFENKDEGPKK